MRRIPELADQNCQACHGSGDATIVDACFSCHTDIAGQFQDGKGLHGQLGQPDAGTCASCHSEHHGAEFRITNERSFQLAGVPRPDEYDHAGLDFRLLGRHGSISCDKCHPFAAAEVLLDGQKRFLGLGQQCAVCHEDVHRGTYGQDCEACHGQQHPFGQAAAFQHTPAFPLQGAHSGIVCQTCHAKDSPSAIDNLLRQDRPSLDTHMAVRACQSCHDSPHSVPFLTAAAQRWQVPGEKSCEACHAVTGSAFDGSQALMSDDFHALLGFPLTAPHDEIACRQCHPGYAEPKGGDEAYRATYPGRHANDCRGCHGDPHDGQFVASLPVVTNCLDCHHRSSFVPAAFGLGEHQRTRFPIQGAHAGLACSECHKPSSASPTDSTLGQSVTVFRGTPNSCRACHADPHLGQFDNVVRQQQDCGGCHDQRSFQLSTFSLLEHGQTQFPLTGAHQAVACQSCHPPIPGDRATGDSPSPHPRAPTRFPRHAARCAACHQDVHRGAFDRPGVPRQINGTTGCLRCHSTVRFDQQLQPDFDHAMWTGYPLWGDHSRAKCVDCHPFFWRPRRTGKNVWPSGESSLSNVSSRSACRPIRFYGGNRLPALSCGG